MPGVYAKPPKRSELSKEVTFILSLLEKKRREGAWAEVMNTCVAMLLDLFAAERSKARAEAIHEKEKHDRERAKGAGTGGQREIPLSEFEARKERDVAEVFFVGGVHAVFCDILQHASGNSEIGDIMPILAVSRMAAVFDRDHCQILTEGLQRLEGLWTSPKGLTHIAQTLASVALFGLGPPLVSALIPASLLWVGASNLIRETRCPCSPCELQRRLLKISRNRDEIGVVQAAKDKKQICVSLVRGGGPGLLRQIFRTAAELRRRTSSVSEQKTEDPTSTQDQCYLDQALQFASWTLLLCSWPYEEVHGGESILAYDKCSLLDAALECFPVSDAGFLESASSLTLPGASSLLSVLLHLLLRLPQKARTPLAKKINLVFRPVLQHLSRRIAERDPYPASAKFFAESADTVSNTPSQGSQGTSAESKAVGVKEQHPADAQPTVEFLLLTPLFMGLLQSMFAEELNERTPCKKESLQNASEKEPHSPRAATTDEINVTADPQTHALVGLGIAACQSLLDMYEYLRPLLNTWEGLESQHCFVEHKGTKEPATQKPFLPSRECLPPSTTVSLMPGFDFRGFYYSLVSAMLTLLGGMLLQSLPERRWRFAENPAAKAGGSAAIGGLASAARKLLDFQKKELSEGCSYIKNAANIVILRAEQASALLLREEAQLKIHKMHVVDGDSWADEEHGSDFRRTLYNHENEPCEQGVVSREPRKERDP
ncbi:hypothetical protein TGGT1_237170 [Toxoplasma gondii GT1]|uniref:Uncharacterized protein n=4 Tax=Toxoplasma gondii TaxID=5811 RepID=S7VYY6_TOXGG|nr:hypothetical protein TGGT1_237170 [Toxoplasma gondii GT1]KAF4640154.1 hypothetical protein TGRH88_040790 [Toxoplasma gondii]KFH07621.1 hypothetical protein TGVAND_237170 [Toxoplasma gondii VAND]KFH16310.1 hypothetical protein TGMAS_237170 [Toxoplasma gondii MAS]